MRAFWMGGVYVSEGQEAKESVIQFRDEKNNMSEMCRESVSRRKWGLDGPGLCHFMYFCTLS